jgi:hypothetical protein
MSWILIDAENKPERGVEVIAFHPDWIDKDSNIKGVRIGYMDYQGKFVSVKWINHYKEDETIVPTHYMNTPDNPIQENSKGSLIRWRVQDTTLILIQYWVEDPDSKSGWQCSGWGEPSDYTLFEVLELDKYGHPIKAMFLKNNNHF